MEIIPDNETEERTENSSDLSTFLIGIFLSVFGIAVLFAVFFTDSYRGKVVNIICGGLFILIGLTSIAAFYHKPGGKKK